MTTKAFRLLLVFYMLTLLGSCIAAVFSTLGFSPALAQAYANEPRPWMDANHLRATIGMAAIFLGALPACLVGLFLFKRWSRLLTLPLTIAGAMTTLLPGPTLWSPAEHLFAGLSATLWGVILATVYFSPIRKQFSRRAPAPAIAAPVPHDDESAPDEIKFRGLATFRQFTAIQNALLPWWARWYVAVVNVLILYFAFADDPMARISSPIGIVATLIAIAFMAIAVWGMVEFSRRRAWRSLSKLNGPVSGRVFEGGIDWNTELSATQLPWKKFTRVRELPDLILVHYSPRCALYFPKNFFASDERWDKFRSLLAARLPSAIDQ